MISLSFNGGTPRPKGFWTHIPLRGYPSTNSTYRLSLEDTPANSPASKGDYVERADFKCDCKRRPLNYVFLVHCVLADTYDFHLALSLVGLAL